MPHRSPQPLFSVIIPTLNEETFLPHLLTALSVQTFRDFEVIVVDGHSEDQTLAVARHHFVRLPHSTVLIVSKRNVAYQRNYGAQHARGSYIVFFDADIVVKSTFLDQLRDRIQQEDIKLATTWIEPDTHDIRDIFLSSFGNIFIELNSNKRLLIS